jgi:hypothetical protein
MAGIYEGRMPLRSHDIRTKLHKDLIRRSGVDEGEFANRQTAWRPQKSISIFQNKERG